MVAWYEPEEPECPLPVRYGGTRLVWLEDQQSWVYQAVAHPIPPQPCHLAAEQAAATPDPAEVRVQVQQAIARLTGGGGSIRFSPAERALANLPTYFWVDGFQVPDEQAVARLASGDQLVLTLRLEGVRWAFHDTPRRVGRRPRRTPERYVDGVAGLGRPWWPTHEGPNGAVSPVSWEFRRGGRYVVTVTYEWTAMASVNGQLLPLMRLASSPPSREVLVDELRVVLTR